MSKQEKIREGIDQYIQEAYWCGEGCQGNVVTDIRNRLIKYLASQGVVIKVGEISDDMAETASQGEIRTAYGVGMSWERNVGMYRAFKEAGYVAVEPLVE